MSSKEMFRLNQITKTYERKIALSSLSLSIKQGETIALIGPSGAGKTTLLNILAHTIESDRGEVFLDNKLIDSYGTRKQLAKKVGIIRQQFDLIEQLPVIHNVLVGRFVEWGFFRSLISMIVPQDKELAVKALARVGLSDKIYERTSNLSGGEQQRVALARLLVQSPEVVLADEPVASLDPARAEDILTMLVTLAKEEKQTLVTVLHSLEYAKKYFNRVIALRNGKIFFDLPTEKITEQELVQLYELKELKEDV